MVRTKQAGFTLVELMITLLIIAILAAISFPSYQSYIRRSNEAAARAAILSIAEDLKRWQAKTLSYRGFTHKSGSNTIYIPAGANATNYKYIVTIVDAVDSTTSDLSLETANGREWRIKAEPNNSSNVMKTANKYYYNSKGQRCGFSFNIAVVLTNGAMCDNGNAMNWQ